MRRMMAAAMFLSLLVACGGDGYGGGYGGGAGVSVGGCPCGGTPGAPSADATVSLSVTNDDAVDYALWMEWPDNLGNPNQEFIALLPAAAPGSVSQVSQDIPVVSGVSYTLLLLDPSGAPWDSASLGILNPGDVLPVNLTVINSAFLAS